MSESFNVKQATMENLNELAAMFNEYRAHYEQESDLEGARQFLIDRLEHKESVIFLITDMEKDSGVGFTQLYPSFSSLSMKRIWILNDLYVRKEYRKKGAAKLLLDAARSFAVQTKAKGLELSTGVDNHIAQKLYEQYGFVKDTDFFHYFLKV
ncbi:GNAT family N-acetyltransferase [Paenibacillus senegalensis]|uniref:GNAT family N-acetyltransferase n=1 Tax=Paenibacillus senegalensis TaxID=1465766 RepID=UPI00028950AE|nr:GNAT family N-acetyltransferase [Paenibacillus senegalensis]